MSFKLFVYYCAVCGAWFGFFGWILGRQITPSRMEETTVLLKTILRGLTLGMMVAFGLGMVDALWNQSTRKIVPVVVRGLFVAVIGCLSGLVGSAVGEAFHVGTGLVLLIPFGWLLTGLLIGASVGTYDLFLRLRRSENPAGAMAKIFNGLLGGAWVVCWGASCIFCWVRCWLACSASCSINPSRNRPVPVPGVSLPWEAVSDSSLAWLR